MSMARSPTIVTVSVRAGDWPDGRRLRALARRAVAAADRTLGEAGYLAGSQAGPHLSRDVSLLFTDDAEMRSLNVKWRGKDSSTNVLSFPQFGPQPGQEGGSVLLGDVILSAETVAREAAHAEKSLEEHMSHLIIHGFLHLLGFDHESEADAEKMEQMERVALRRLGIADPYATTQAQ